MKNTLMSAKKGQAGLDIFQSIMIGLLLLAFIGGFTYIALGKFGAMSVVSSDGNATAFVADMKQNVSDTVDWLPLVILALILGAVLFVIFMAVRMWRGS